MVTYAEFFDLPPDSIPMAYKGPTVCKTAAEARAEVARMREHPDVPQDYQEASTHCIPKEIEFMNLMLEGSDAAAAAGQAFRLKGRSATNKGCILTTKTPRVMLALEIGRKEIAAKGEYGVQQALERLTLMAEEARGKGQLSAAVRAEELKMKLVGLLGPDDKSSDDEGDPRSDAELREHAKQLARELGLDKPPEVAVSDG